MLDTLVVAIGKGKAIDNLSREYVEACYYFVEKEIELFTRQMLGMSCVMCRFLDQQ
jgi:hypothetical protein